MATSNVRLHPIQFTIKIFLSFKLQTSPIQKRHKMREANKKNTTNHHRSCVKQFIIVTIEISRSHVLAAHSIRIGYVCVREKRSAFFPRRWLLMFSLSFSLYLALCLSQYELSKWDTSTAGISTGTFYYTHTQTPNSNIMNPFIDNRLMSVIGYLKNWKCCFIAIKCLLANRQQMKWNETKIRNEMKCNVMWCACSRKSALKEIVQFCFYFFKWFS